MVSNLCKIKIEKIVDYSFCEKNYMKNGYWKKINDEVIQKITARCFKLQDQAPLEAVILQFLLVELFLRSEILIRLKSKKKKYFDKDDCKFSQLIDYYDLLNGDEKTTLLLRQYNKKRNEIIHHALKFKSIKDLEKEAEKTFNLGQKLIETS